MDIVNPLGITGNSFRTLTEDDAVSIAVVDGDKDLKAISNVKL
jgi:cold shock CspA family protein